LKQYLLPPDGNYYKVNMHCHTVISDGAQTPEEVKKLFKENGYSAVAFTDHEFMMDHSDLNDPDFIALTAYEYGFDKSPVNYFPGVYEGELKTRDHAVKVHLNLISKDPHDARMVCCDLKYIWGNAKKYLDTAEYTGDGCYKRKNSAEGVNEVIRAARERNMLVIYNHPNWSMNGENFYNALEGLTGLEIINGDGGADSDMEDVPYVYQNMARAGKRIICVAGDDNHSEAGSCLAWTMVNAASLTYENLIDGIERGNCYASAGPSIHELFIEDGYVHVTTSEAAGIYLYTAGRRGDRKLRERGGEPVTSAVFKVSPLDCMFRLAVRDLEGHHAYTRYYYFDELKGAVPD